jgi:hypothetical protein
MEDSKAATNRRALTFDCANKRIFVRCPGKESRACYPGLVVGKDHRDAGDRSWQ